MQLQQNLHYPVISVPILSSYNRTYISQLYQYLYYPVTTEPTLAVLQQNVSIFCKFIFPEAVFDHNH